MLVRDERGCYANSVETDLYLDRNKQTYVGGLLERFSVEQYDIWASLTAAIKLECHNAAGAWLLRAPLCRREVARSLRERHDREDTAGGKGAGGRISFGSIVAPSSTSAHHKAACRSKSHWPIRISLGVGSICRS